MMIDSFIIYTNYIEKLQVLNDTQLGTLFRAILEYEYSELKEMPDIQDEAVKVAFYFIKSDLDNNYQKYLDTCNKRKENLKKANASKESANATQMQSECTPNAVQMGGDNENDNENDNDNNIKKENTKEKAPRFSPPSLEEVRAYCQERGNVIDPEQFVNFYESKGWKIGKEKMKDWKACVRTWEKRNKISKPNYSIDNSSLNITDEDIAKYLPRGQL